MPAADRGNSEVGGEPEKIQPRVQAAVYGAATFSNTMPNMYWVVMPLWVASLDVSAVMIGVALGCRHIGPVLLSIHGGTLMDRFGIRRLMLIFATVGTVTPLLFPLFPGIWAVIMLQIVVGLVDSLGWVGAQMLVGREMKGDPKYAGRMSFCTRLGLFAGPPLAGLAWDLIGPFGGFAMVSLWSAGILASLMLLRGTAFGGPADQRQALPAPVTLKSILPSLADYQAAFRLLALPAMAFIMVMTVLRHVGGGIQGSFYVVYLEGIGISATMIGVLLTVSGVFGLAGSLSVAPLLRFQRAHWFLLWTVIVSLVFVVITPALGALPELMLATGLRGWALAASLVLLMTLIARIAGPQMQGPAMGLRVTLNQTVWFIVPIAMGGLIELIGMAASFYLIGAVTLGLMVFAGWRVARVRPFDENESAGGTG